jgi:ubiquinone/menaquinone biosynthesis C-methylase UbiE
MKMKRPGMFSRDEVISANIALHSALADKYKETEPHYRKENIERVSKILSSLQEGTRGKRLLDIGCGTGFIIDIAKCYFDTIRGIDVTQAMLDRIDKSSEKADIEVQLAESEKLPFEDQSFDVCTAYAVLHHLDRLQPTFREIHRVLVKGGIFYSDLDPNFYFWQSLSALSPNGGYSEIVNREINAVLHKDRELEETFHIDKSVLRTAEHLKHEEGGFKEEQLRGMLSEAGFREIEIRYEWFLGEARVIHGEDERILDALRSYLQEILPLSKHLFKYLIIYAKK